MGDAAEKLVVVMFGKLTEPVEAADPSHLDSSAARADSTLCSSSCPPAGPKRQTVTMMGNKATGGPFAPLVVATRNVMGEKEFNQLRGTAISLHSQGEEQA